MLAVVSDTKKSNGDANLVSYSDYFPFGSSMMGRVSKSGDYRYGFGGHEKDDEVKGDGNYLAFGDYGYDTRLGRRLDVDPLCKTEASWTSYRAFFNNPLMYIDTEGSKEFITNITIDEAAGKVKIEKTTANRLMSDGKKRMVKENNAVWHYEVDYYDFNTINIYKTDENGITKKESSRSMIVGKPQDSDKVWRTGKNFTGDTKWDASSWIYEHTPGGLLIYGDAHSSKDSPGTKVSPDKVYGSIDFSAFMEIMGLAGQSISSKKDLSLDSDADGFKLIDLVDKAVEVSKFQNEHSDSYCTTCKGAFDKEGKPISDDKKTKKDTIEFNPETGHRK